MWLKFGLVMLSHGAETDTLLASLPAWALAVPGGAQ